MFELPGLRRHLPLAIALGVDSIGTGISAPLLLLFLTKVANIPLAQAGVTLSATFAVALFVPAVAGQVVPRLGGRTVLIAAQVLQALGLAGFLVVRELPAIVACALVLAIGQRTFWSSVFAVIADASDSGPPADKDRWFAFTNMIQNTGYALGALTAGALLLIPGDLPYLLAIGANATFLALSGILMLAERAGQPTRTAPEVAPPRIHRAPSRPYLAYIGVSALFAFCSTLLGSGLAIYVVDGLSASAAVVGPLLAVNTLLSAIGQAPAVRLTRRFSRVRVMILAGLIWCVWGLFTASLGHTPASLIVPALALSVVIYSIAELLHGPRSMAFAADAAPPDQRSTYLSWFQYSFALANIAAPGVFAATFGIAPALPWLIASLVAILACLGLAAVARVLHPQPPVQN
ncbi:MFS transporter [Occultella aeris]|uniref:Putative MFS family transporter protein n=1 Tax=Occultella aeris TaxID=2761496 RepID=A0A7M4DG75_9MICO|nr:MFS transporter [Occultella aeris]VZO35918.1 putative MFS family transporter protein [Occultella aeris]